MHSPVSLSALTLRRKAASLFLGFAVLGFAAACSATADTRTASPVTCEIALDAIPGGTRVSGILTAGRAVAGTYDLQIRSGSASIRQGGDFEARPGERITLAETELVGPRAGQQVALEIRHDGERQSCRQPAF